MEGNEKTESTRAYVKYTIKTVSTDATTVFVMRVTIFCGISVEFQTDR